MIGTTDFTGSAAVDFGSATINEIDECITLSDTHTEFSGPKIVCYSDLTDELKTFDYPKTIGPYSLPGISTVQNTASFSSGDTGTAGSDSWTVTIYRIGSAVTSSNFYNFDYDAAAGRQFKLILTPDVPTYPNLYRVTASNPGQFFYNIFYYAASPTSTPFTITIPDPFVTQGANPVHVYDSIATSGNYMLPDGNDITSQFTITPTYAGDVFTGFIITPIGTYSGPIYITIHLDYGYKKILGGLGKDKNNNALLGSTIKIYDLSNYIFSVSEPLTDSDTVKNRNVFKRDPGFVGLVTNSEGAPVANVKVQIYGPTGTLLGTVYTDNDGWYFYNYKYQRKSSNVHHKTTSIQQKYLCNYQIKQHDQNRLRRSIRIFSSFFSSFSFFVILICTKDIRLKPCQWFKF